MAEDVTVVGTGGPYQSIPSTPSSHDIPDIQNFPENQPNIPSPTPNAGTKGHESPNFPAPSGGSAQPAPKSGGEGYQNGFDT